MSALSRDLGEFFLPSGRAHDICSSLQTAILEHRLLPGTKLSEDEVGELFGASRTVVRAALQALAHSGMVEMKRNRGAFVAQPSTRDAEEVFEARSLIEPEVARRAARQITAVELTKLETHIDAEHEALAAGDMGRALALSGRFHISIAESARHAIYTQMVRSLIAQSSLVIALYWNRADTTCESHSHHALIDAFQSADEQKAHDVMRSHLVDLYSGLDLRSKPETTSSLAEALSSH
ncbi:MAG: GntR family transcriptional regulator [Pseudomonadota bacterium]